MSIVFNPSWEDCKSQGKLETNLMEKCMWVNKLYYGKSERTVFICLSGTSSQH